VPKATSGTVQRYTQATFDFVNATFDIAKNSIVKFQLNIVDLIGTFFYQANLHISTFLSLEITTLIIYSTHHFTSLRVLLFPFASDI
jgi:hypothetical protein